LYGGEVVREPNGAIRGEFNNSEHMIHEMFITHTTYLNRAWNYQVLNAWRADNYTGDNPLYFGMSNFDYISNHLGYRYVLRSSEISQNGNALSITGSIENVGAGNMINEKKAEIVLRNGSVEHVHPVTLDIRTLLSRESIDYVFLVSDLNSLTNGTWEVYLRLSEAHYHPNFPNNNAVRFANANIWNNSIRGNFLGEFSIISPSP
jgi:hypothetical protein